MFKVFKSFEIPVHIVHRETKQRKIEYVLFPDDYANDSVLKECYTQGREEALETGIVGSDTYYSPFLSPIDNDLPTIVDGHNILGDYSFEIESYDFERVFSQLRDGIYEEDTARALLPEPIIIRGIVHEDQTSAQIDVLCHEQSPGICMFMYGRGEDGGFGDYANPPWSGFIQREGIPLTVSTEEDAEEIVNILNDKAEKEFYDNNVVDAFSGLFPVEYTFRKIPFPEEVIDQMKIFPKEEIINTITEMHEKGWKSTDDFF